MAVKELKKLSRKELLEMLIVQGKENEELRARSEQMEKQLSERHLQMENVGTMAEAMLMLNGVCQAADSAAQQYLDGVRGYCEAKRAEGDGILADARREAEEILEAARSERLKMLDEADRMLKNVNDRLHGFFAEHPELKECMPFDDGDDRVSAGDPEAPAPDGNAAAEEGTESEEGEKDPDCGYPRTGSGAETGRV